MSKSYSKASKDTKDRVIVEQESADIPNEPIGEDEHFDPDESKHHENQS